MKISMNSWRHAVLAVAAGVLCGTFASSALAEPLRVGKGAGTSFPTLPLEVGLDVGIFKKHDLDVQSFGFDGGGKMHQGMAARAIDIGIGSGPEMALVAKGSPEIAVADVAGPLLFLGVLVPYDSPVKSVADLKSKIIGVSAVGSLSDWIAHEMARQNGWSPDDIHIVGISSNPAARTAAFAAGQISADIGDISAAYFTEGAGRARLLLPVSDFVKDFVTLVLFASNDIVARDPSAVRRFIQAWLETVEYMRTHKAETVEVTRKFTGYTADVQARQYDQLMPMFSSTGRFDPKGMAVLKQSFLDLHLLDPPIDMSKLYTEKFLTPE